MKPLHFLRRKRVVFPLALTAVWAAVWFALPFLVPLPENLSNAAPVSPVVLDRHGRPIHRLTLPDATRAETISLTDLPPDFVACTLAAEDKRFRNHGGIDLLAGMRACKDLAAHRRVVSGASTITQQLVKISSPPCRRTVAAKLRESLGARHLEMTRSKDEILVAYLNRLDYGNRRIGPAEAARFYFQKPLADLSLAECALLAGLPQAPTRLNPIKRPAAALQRRDLILNRLAKTGVDLQRLALARQEPLLLRPFREKSAAAWLLARSSHSAIRIPNSELRTTLDLDLQRDVESIVTEELNGLRTANLHHAAVVVLHNPTGEILALVTSGDWRDPRGGQIDGTWVPRSPGSTLKPFTYLLGFERAGQFPGSILADVPTRFRTPEGLDLPANFDRTHRGPVSIRTALACSLNVPAMRELNLLGGPAPLHRLLTDLGLTTLGDNPTRDGLGLTIGNAPVRLLELTNAYATLARGGHHLPSRLFSVPSEEKPHKLFDPVAAYLIADILADPDARAPSFGRHGPLELPFRCAVKTGTSSDFHDNWCIGFTRDFTVGVWAGNFDQTPLGGISGVAGAGPVFHRTMVRLHRDQSPAWFEPPAGIATIRIDPRTGHRLTDPADSRGKTDWCPEMSLPLFASPSDYDSNGKALLDASFGEWFASAANLRRQDFALASDRPAPEPLKILAPADGVICLLDPELPSGGKTLRLASNLPGVARWSSPTLVLDSNGSEPVARLVPGTHVLAATDPRDGTIRQVTIHVREL
ncbi:MAG TPA: transglycosylase domain-containing protein [Luteolibacter sp.]